MKVLAGFFVQAVFYAELISARLLNNQSGLKSYNFLLGMTPRTPPLGFSTSPW